MKNTISRKLKRFARKVLPLFPEIIRFPLMRAQLKVDTQMPKGLEIRVARSKEELTAAYRILHDSYVQMGYMTPQESGMRIIKYFALPTTTTLIACLNDKVIGTLSVIRRTSMGLPLEDIFPVNSYCGNEAVAEISSLAIDQNFRMENGAVFLPLLKYLFEYLRNYMGIDRIFLAVNPRQVDFYRGILLFDRIDGNKNRKYDFANNHEAVILMADFRILEKRGQEIYGSKKDKANLFKYFYQFESPILKFPDRPFKKVMDPVLTPHLFSFLFAEQSQVIEKLSIQDKLLLSKFYSAEFQELIWSATPLRVPKQRFPVALKTSDQISILDVSRQGLKVQATRTLLDGDLLQVEVAKGVQSHLQIQVVWSNPQSQEFGLRIQAADSTWNDYLSFLEKDFIAEEPSLKSISSNRKSI